MLKRLWPVAALLTLVLAGAAVGAAPQQRTLPNGVRVVAERYSAAPVAAVRVYLRAGSTLEGRYAGTGITHLLEHLGLHGGVKYQGDQVWAKIRDLGEDANAYTSKDVTCYHITTTADHALDALELLADMVFSTHLTEAGVKQEQDTIARENSGHENEPGRVLHDLFSATLFPTHPEHIPIGGHPASLAALTLADVIAYRRERYQPDNVVVALVGDFDPQQMLDEAGKLLAAYPPGAAVPVALPDEPLPVSRRTQVLVREDVQRTHLLLGWRGVSSSHPDMYPLDLLAQILGSGDTSILVSRLQNQRGLVDNIYCWDHTPTYDAGAFQIGATCDPRKTDEVVAAILAEIAQIREKGVTAAQVAKALRQAEAQKIFSEQDPASRAESLGYGLLLYGDPDFTAQYLRRLARVTPAQVLAAARRYLPPDTVALALLMPPGTAASVAGPAPAAAKLPTTMFKLANGVRVIFTPEPGTGTLALAAAVQAGQRLEPEGQAGVSRFTALMLTRGAGGRARAALAERLEARGASLSPFSGANSLGVEGRALAPDAGLLLETAALALQRPDFPASEIELLRQETLAAIQAQQESPYRLANLMVRELLYPASPYRFPDTGTVETVKALTRADLQRFCQSRVYPQALVLALSGDLTLDTAKELTQKHFGRWQARGTAPRPPSAPQPSTQRVERTLERTQNETLIYYAWIGPTLTGPDRYAWDVLLSVLNSRSGEGRLFPTLREAGLVYAAGAFQIPGLDPGEVALYAATRAEQLTEVRQRIEEAVRQVQETLLSPTDLSQTQESLRIQHALGEVNPAARVQARALDEAYGLGYEEPDRYAAGIAAVTAPQVQELARRALDLSRAVVVITRPAKGES